MKKNVYIYIYVELNHFAVHQKLTQHCKLTILQFKKEYIQYIIRLKATRQTEPTCVFF